MNILYIGDVMGEPGRGVLRLVLPELKKEMGVDLVIAQAENVSHGKSMTPHHMDLLLSYGVDFFTGGNHTFKRTTLYERLQDPDSPVIGPANINDEQYPKTGHKVVKTKEGNVLVTSILGSVFPEDLPISSPLNKIDEVLELHRDENLAAIVVDIHSDYSSEKVMMGHYLDGKVSMVVGDHWHVPTNDARILPKGTAHMTDVGMCGSLNSSLGIELNSTLPRWRDGSVTKKVMATTSPYQFNAVIVDTTAPNQANSIEVIRRILE